MSDRRRYRHMSDEELESRISALPRRVPRPALREDILSQAARRKPRGMRLSRPVFALAALVVLLAADLLALSWQDGGAKMPRARLPVPAVAEARPEEDDQLAWLREIGASDTALLVALRPASGGHQQTYFELRERLLAANNGG